MVQIQQLFNGVTLLQHLVQEGIHWEHMVQQLLQLIHLISLLRTSHSKYVTKETTFYFSTLT